MFHTILIDPLFNLLAVIYAWLPRHDFGLAIIILTLIVRAILWPLVARQLHSQRAMQKLQPEIAKIRARHKGDRPKESQALMQLYKEKGVNPLASLLPLFIQLPIFIALYAVLRDVVKPGEFAHLAYTPVQHLGPIAAIIHSGSGFTASLLGWVDLSRSSWVLALLAAGAQFIQTRMLLPKPAPDDKQARAMAGATSLFPIITFIVGLSLPSALALYWTVSSSAAIFQQWLLLRRDVQEMEGEK